MRLTVCQLHSIKLFIKLSHKTRKARQLKIKTIKKELNLQFHKELQALNTSDFTVFQTQSFILLK